MSEQRIGFIGAGRMATALAGGFVRAGVAAADHLLASDRDAEALRRFAQATAVPTIDDNARLAERSDVIFLAVKPQHVPEAAAGLRGKIASGRLLVSIAAGVRLETLERLFGAGPRLIRAMPNNPCMAGQGASAYCLGRGASNEDGALVGRLLDAVGAAWRVDEEQMDAVTALCGSGPAFAYKMIEALGEAGTQLGLPWDTAAAMAAQTVHGAAEMALTTGMTPAELLDAVASPGGTTVAGLKALESGDFHATMIAAVEAAARRSKELGVY